jgi:hypothetical protein
MAVLSCREYRCETKTELGLEGQESNKECAERNFVRPIRVARAMRSVAWQEPGKNCPSERVGVSLFVAVRCGVMAA